MWRRGECTTVKARLVDKRSDTPSIVTASKVQAAKSPVVGVGGNVAVAAVDGVTIVPLGVKNNVSLIVPDAAEYVS
jgi:hypothetical protein